MHILFHVALLNGHSTVVYELLKAGASTVVKWKGEPLLASLLSEKVHACTCTIIVNNYLTPPCTNSYVFNTVKQGDCISLPCNSSPILC